MTKNPLLALESTVIAHGLPYPQNVETAREMEAVARSHGVEPRTVAVIRGVIHVGLTDAELLHLAQATDVMKLARRDIAIALAQKRDGATTVSATMYLAHRAGIRVFATGGVGGVHRAGNQYSVSSKQPELALKTEYGSLNTGFDISADLLELTTTPVVVVCAGVKAILDLPATLEYLETHSVPVLGYQTDEFPAFYSRSSGLRLQARVNSAMDAAKIIRAHWELGNPGGVMVCAPIPAENELPREEIEPFIERALQDAQNEHVVGNAVTPFLLKRLEEITGGRSVRSNIALLKNNVAVGAEIAKALAALDLPVA